MLLEAEGRALPAGGRAVEPAEIVHRQSPLRADAVDLLGGPHQVGADAEAPAAGLGGIDVVVGTVEQGAVLVLEVGIGTSAVVDLNMLDGDAIAGGVAVG